VHGRSGLSGLSDVYRAAARLAGVASVVVDCETGPVRLGLAGDLAIHLGARTVRLDDLVSDDRASDGLRDVVRHARRAA
jgi:magnesium chelatase subunit D